MAWKKGSVGPAADWIGVTISADVAAGSATIALRPRKVAELLEGTRNILSMPVVPVRELQAFAGKVNFAAGLIVILRAALSWLWAAHFVACERLPPAHRQAEGTSARR